METTVPYMPSVKNLHKMLDAIQHAGVPEVFNLDFLKDLGFTSSNDRPAIKVLKFLGFLDASGRPQDPYRQFVDQTKAKGVLARRLAVAYDDLYLSDKAAHTRTVTSLKGWFKTKTGASDSVSEKVARTFKSLADYADFSVVPKEGKPKEKPSEAQIPSPPPLTGEVPIPPSLDKIGLVYRLEIHLPDTQNVDTFRAIFRAMREELLQ